MPPWLQLAVSLFFSPSLTDRTSPLLTHLSLPSARSQNTISAHVTLENTETQLTFGTRLRPMLPSFPWHDRKDHAAAAEQDR